MYTLVVTVKLNHVDGQASRAGVLAGNAKRPHTRVHALVPWNRKAARHRTLAARTATYPRLRLRVRLIPGLRVVAERISCKTQPCPSRVPEGAPNARPD